jgi:hypothetical protein
VPENCAGKRSGSPGGRRPAAGGRRSNLGESLRPARTDLPRFASAVPDA